MRIQSRTSLPLEINIYSADMMHGSKRSDLSSCGRSWKFSDRNMLCPIKLFIFLLSPMFCVIKILYQLLTIYSQKRDSFIIIILTELEMLLAENMKPCNVLSKKWQYFLTQMHVFPPKSTSFMWICGYMLCNYFKKIVGRTLFICSEVVFSIHKPCNKPLSDCTLL